MASFSSKTVSVGGLIPTLANIDALRNHLPRNLRDGDSVLVSGQTEPGDKNGGVYVWQEGSDALDDGLNVVKPATSIASGRWVLSVGRGIQGDVGPRGLKGDTGPQGQGLSDVMAPTGSTLIGYKGRTVASKLDDALNLADFAGFSLNTSADMSSVWQTAIDAAAVSGRALRIPAGFTNASGLILRDGINIIGEARSSTIKHIADGKPLFTTPLGVIQNVSMQNLSLVGHGQAGEILLYLNSQSQTTSPFHGGTWRAIFANLQFLNGGGKNIWLRGGAEQINPNTGQADTAYRDFLFDQFITFRDVISLRGATQESRCISLTGACGQIYFEGACHFDSAGEGANVAPGFNVNFSRLFKKTVGATVVYGDAADAFFDAAYQPVSDNAPYRTNLSATVQGAAYGVMIDRGEVSVIGSYFEHTERCLVAQASAFVEFTDNTIRNSGYSATSGDGFLISNKTAGVIFGRNRIKGAVDRTYIYPDGSVPQMYNRIAEDFSEQDLGGKSKTTAFIGVGPGTSLKVYANSFVLVTGGDSSNPAIIRSIDSIAGGQSLLYIQGHYGCNLQIQPGAGITTKDNAVVNVRQGQVVTMIRRDFVFGWSVI